MDRLLALTACLATAIAGCDGEPKPPPATGRVQAVVAKTPGADALAGFCDLQPQAAGALQLPALAGGGQGPAQPKAGEGPGWVNLWATWCRPCLEELPMILRWQAEWRDRDVRAAVSFISVDRSQADLSAFLADHPGLPDHRLADPEALTPFMAQLGLDSGAGLPLHIFTGAGGRIRCVRAGAVAHSHKPLIEKALLAAAQRPSQ